MAVRHPRMHRTRSVSFAAGVLGALLLPCATTAGAAVVRDVRVLRDATTTRIVLDLDGPVRYRTQRSDDGRAILVDLGDASLAADAPRVLPVSDRRIDGVLMQDDPESRVVRLSVDFAGRVAPRLDANLEGSHLVLDFRASSEAGPPAAQEASPPPPRRGGARPQAVAPSDTPPASARLPREDGEAGDWKLAKARARARAEAMAARGEGEAAKSEGEPAKGEGKAPEESVAERRPPARPATAQAPHRSVLERPVVVLDPGHGGKDPGARAWTGEVEKDIVLDLAERVARRLRKGGDIEVVMTRSGDEFVELADRREASRRWGADVFVSIHANASHNVAARGIETYYHSRTVADRGMRRLVRAENGGTPSRGSGRAASLSKTSLSRSAGPVLDRRSESIRLAKAVQGELVRQLGMRYEAIRDLGAKEGPFFVIGENAAPSVLVEAAFLTHREEGLRMRSEVYREQIADGVARGILLFLEQQRRAGTL